MHIIITGRPGASGTEAGGLAPYREIAPSPGWAAAWAGLLSVLMHILLERSIRHELEQSWSELIFPDVDDFARPSDQKGVAVH